MPRIRLAIVAAVTAAAVALPAHAVTVPTLSGTVGPEFFITVKRAGKRVTTLRRGRYTFRISDRSDFHNFSIRGPGINRDLTTVPFVGTARPVTLTLRRGRYVFYCVPHPTDMRGVIRVT